MAAFDFTGPFVAARIIDSEGNAYPLWTNVGGSETDRAIIPGGEELQALAFLQQVEVQLALSYVPKISAQLSPPFREGIAFLNSDLANSGARNILEVQFGYTGGTSGGEPILSPPLTGVLTNPEVTIDVDVQITLNAQGLGGFGSQRQTGNRVSREDTTLEDLIREVAAGTGRELQVNFDDAKKDNAVSRLLSQPIDWAQGGKTDWMALWELTTRAQCWMSLVGDTLYILARKQRLTGAPERRYRMYDYPGGQMGGVAVGGASGALSDAELPILSFSSPTSAVWLPASVLGAAMRDVNDKTREPVQENLTMQSEAEPSQGEGSQTVEGGPDLPEADEETGEGGASFPGDPGNPEARRQVSEEVAKEAHLGVEVDIETMGDPDVLPGAIVRIAGVGRRFDERTYAVHEITHSIGVGGYTTNLRLITNVDTLLTELEGGEAGTGPTNDQEVDESAGPGGVSVNAETQSET